MTEAIPRITARVILAAPDDRVLLFRYLLPAPWRRLGWLTPGGAVEPGESPDQAAARELGEETGVQLTPAELGAPVAFDSGEWWAEDGTLFSTTNWYFFARSPAARVDLSGQDDAERDDLIDHRWWTVDHIAATGDPVFPTGLADLLPRLLSGDLPTEPVHLTWD